VLWASMGWGARRLGLRLRKSYSYMRVLHAGNPGGHTDTRVYLSSIVNPIRALETKAEAVAGP